MGAFTPTILEGLDVSYDVRTGVRAHRRRKQAEIGRRLREQAEAGGQRRRDDEEAQRRRQEAARPPAPAPTPPAPGWTPNPAGAEATPTHTTTVSDAGSDYGAAASTAARYAGSAPSIPPIAPRKPGIISPILMWLGFVGALAVFAEPISGLFWLAIGSFTWRWRKEQRQAFQAHEAAQGTPAPYGSATGLPTHR